MDERRCRPVLSRHIGWERSQISGSAPTIDGADSQSQELIEVCGVPHTLRALPIRRSTGGHGHEQQRERCTMTVTESIEFVDGVEMYRIAPIDRIDPFLMTVVSNSDLWMFVSSTGGLTAGRVEPEQCIFPYETDDRLHHLSGRVGPVTVLRVDRSGTTTLWEPFTADRSRHPAQPPQESARQHRDLRRAASRARTHDSIPLGTLRPIRLGSNRVVDQSRRSPNR